MTASKSTATAKVFSSSPPESGFGKVYRNNINNNSFTQNQQQALKMVTTNSETALFYNAVAIRNSDEILTCKVIYLIIKISSVVYTAYIFTISLY